MNAPELLNPVPAEEIPGWTRAMLTTFLADPYAEEALRRIAILERSWDPARAWGARADGRWVATLRSEARRLTVPGRGSGAGASHQANDILVDALTNVTVAATHRRRGLMARMLTGSLAAARERSDALSVLIAAEWPIYGRFGYAPATLMADLRLDPTRVAQCDFGDASRLHRVDPAGLTSVVPQVFARARLRNAGQLDRDGDWWPRYFGAGGFPPSPELPPSWLIHDGTDGPDGFVAWRSDGNFNLSGPAGRVEVLELATASDEAYRDLWAYLASLDAVKEVRLRQRPPDEPVSWMLPDARALTVTELMDFLWLRLLDVPGALSARGYAAPGEIVLDVVDDEGGWAAGRFLLEAGEDGGASCAPTRRAPQLHLSQRALAAAYLGGFRLSRVALGGGVLELEPGALARADLMFSTAAAPWNATWF